MFTQELAETKKFQHIAVYNSTFENSNKKIHGYTSRQILKSKTIPVWKEGSVSTVVDFELGLFIIYQIITAITGFIKPKVPTPFDYKFDAHNITLCSI